MFGFGSKKEIEVLRTEIEGLKKNAPIPGPTNLDPTFLKSFMQLLSSDDDRIKNVRKEPYANQTWVYACASAIARRIRGLPVELKSNEELISPSVASNKIERVLSRPNNIMTGPQFIENVLLDLLLPSGKGPGGQSFIIPSKFSGEKVKVGLGEIPDLLFPYSEDVVKPVLNREKTGLLGWNFGFDNHKIFYEPTELIRVYLVNPYHYLLGMSPIWANMFSLLSDTKAARLSEMFMENGANIGGILSTKEHLSEPKADKLQERWDTKYSGVTKSGETALLYGGLEYQNISKSLTDLSFVEQRQMSRDEVMAVYGVSKFILGMSDSVNRATAKEEQELFWNNTLMPYMDVLWDSLNVQWLGNINPEITAGFDLTNVQALKKDLSQKIDSAAKLIEQGVPPAEAYRMLEIPVNSETMAWLNRPLVTGSRVDLRTGEVVGSSPPTAPENTKVVPATKKKKNSGIENLSPEEIETNAQSSLWEDWVSKTIEVPEKEAVSALDKFFKNQLKESLKLIDAWAAKSKTNNTILNADKPDVEIDVSDFLPSKDNQDEALAASLKPAYESALEKQAKYLSGELSELIEFDPKEKKTLEILAARREFTDGINTTTFKKYSKLVGDVVKEGVTKNVPVKQIAKDLKAGAEDFFETRNKGAAQTIARTEAASVANNYRLKSFIEQGFTKHKWMTARDENVRRDHKRGTGDGGKVVKIGKRFPKTRLLYPTENGGPPGQVINCRCLTVPRV